MCLIGFSFGDKRYEVSLHNLDCPGTSAVDKADPGLLEIRLPQECWDCLKALHITTGLRLGFNCMYMHVSGGDLHAIKGQENLTARSTCF